MTKFLTAILILASLVLTSCESKTKKAAELSYQFSGLVLDLARATERAYQTNAITTAQKDQAVVIIRKMNQGAQSLNDIVKQLAKDTSVPADKKALINRILAQEIIDPFLTLIASLGAAAQVQALYPVITAIRVAILTLGNTFGGVVDQTQIRRLERYA